MTDRDKSLYDPIEQKLKPESDVRAKGNNTQTSFSPPRPLSINAKLSSISPAISVQSNDKLREKAQKSAVRQIQKQEVDRRRLEIEKHEVSSAIL